MAQEAWSVLLHVYGLVYQALVPCAVPELLAASSLNIQQYLGKWYFVAAVSSREADIHMFRGMDSTVFTLEETAVNNTLLLTGVMRIGDKCQNATWTYHIHPEREELVLAGKPERKTLLWSGAWLNCLQCIILQETEPPLKDTDTEDSLGRHMLYARQSMVDPAVVKAFQTKSSCNEMDAFVRLPQEKEFCI
ncbi:apolipoprotein M [Lampris incognitus]|uniref:apolipoprotein M n=1 Tax=Lampris incognitus TaxID=2546036 RepID=UPI0024B57435|nr:apolipoprotein M [Lampris incognitus]